MSQSDIEEWNRSEIKKILGNPNVSEFRNTINNYANLKSENNIPEFANAFSQLAIMLIGVSTNSFDINVISDQRFMLDFFKNKKVNIDLLEEVFIDHLNKSKNILQESNLVRINNESQTDIDKNVTTFDIVKNMMYKKFRKDVLIQIDKDIYKLFFPTDEIDEFIIKDELQYVEDIFHFLNEKPKYDRFNDKELKNFHKENYDKYCSVFTILIDYIDYFVEKGVLDTLVNKIRKIKRHINNDVKKIIEIQMMAINTFDLDSQEIIYKNYRNLNHAFDTFIDVYELYKLENKF